MYRVSSSNRANTHQVRHPVQPLIVQRLGPLSAHGHARGPKKDCTKQVQSINTELVHYERTNSGPRGTPWRFKPASRSG
jgi:hypothetical protein